MVPSAGDDVNMGKRDVDYERNPDFTTTVANFLYCGADAVDSFVPLFPKKYSPNLQTVSIQSSVPYGP